MRTVRTSAFALPSHSHARRIVRRLELHRLSAARVVVLVCTIAIVSFLHLGPSAATSSQHCGKYVRLVISIQASPITAKHVGRLLDALWDKCNLYAVHIHFGKSLYHCFVA